MENHISIMPILWLTMWILLRYRVHLDLLRDYFVPGSMLYSENNRKYNIIPASHESTER